MKDIPGYERIYAVTKEGLVWSYPRIYIAGKGSPQPTGNRFKAQTLRNGYKAVLLYKGGGQKDRRTFNVHRLVAQAFIPNIFNLPHVNHINGDKEDNRLENLEWSTVSYNRRHAVYFKKYQQKTGFEDEVAKMLFDAADFCALKFSKITGKDFGKQYRKWMPFFLEETRKDMDKLTHD